MNISACGMLFILIRIFLSSCEAVQNAFRNGRKDILRRPVLGSLANSVLLRAHYRRFPSLNRGFMCTLWVHQRLLHVRDKCQ